MYKPIALLGYNIMKGATGNLFIQAYKVGLWYSIWLDVTVWDIYLHQNSEFRLDQEDRLNPY